MRTGLELGEVVRSFMTRGNLVDAFLVNGGHIHDTYRVVTDANGVIHQFALQRINTHVFPRVHELMENVERVSAHVAACVANDADAERRALRLAPLREGGHLYRDAEDGYWRMFRWIGGAHAQDRVDTPEQAYRIARAFGRFQRQLNTLSGPRLEEPIPGFHDTPKRFAALEQAIAADAVGRVAEAQPEIAFAMQRKTMSASLVNAGLPERVAHCDAKPNNVLLDDVSGEALCVIDLDTVMPGLAVYDFGDLVRSCASPTAEDERDLSLVELRFEYFEALARGYLHEARSFLTCAEKDHLVAAGKVITFENGIRFLADYLAGDTYYKVHRPEQNLDRCRTHFKLVESIEQQECAMMRLVQSIG